MNPFLNPKPNRVPARRPLAIAACIGVAVAGLFTGPPASHAESPSATAPTTAPGPQQFATAEAAATALVEASRKGDISALVALLGQDARDVVASGDSVADANAQAKFCAAYDTKHALAPDNETMTHLVVGPGDWPMPCPIVKDASGQWHVDAAAGRDEILNRRIGHNERAAMQTLLAIVDAEREYVRLDPDHDGLPAYAERFASHPGTHDGLFWEAAPGEPVSPLGPLFQEAAVEGYTSTTRPAVGPRKAYHGYFYRILTGQGPAATGGAVDYHADDNHGRGPMIGGFAVLAWPADYGNSGVMTFLVNHQGVLYQQNLGDKTRETVDAITLFDPTPAWTKCEDMK